jgi:hypothetical protein
MGSLSPPPSPLPRKWFQAPLFGNPCMIVSWLIGSQARTHAGGARPPAGRPHRPRPPARAPRHHPPIAFAKSYMIFKPLSAMPPDLSISPGGHNGSTKDFLVLVMLRPLRLSVMLMWKQSEAGTVAPQMVSSAKKERGGRASTPTLGEAC